jgi:acyl carrier protein
MKSESEIFQSLAQLLKERYALEEETILREQRLQEDLGLESMDLLALAVEVENLFQVKLEEDPGRPPQTIGELARLVEQRLSEAGR